MTCTCCLWALGQFARRLLLQSARNSAACLARVKDACATEQATWTATVMCSVLLSAVPPMRLLWCVVVYVGKRQVMMVVGVCARFVSWCDVQVTASEEAVRAATAYAR